MQMLMKTLNLLKSAKKRIYYQGLVKSEFPSEMARLIMEVGLQSKNLERRELKREIIKICYQMKEDISLILANTVVNYCLNKVTGKTLIKVKHRHEKTLANLRHTKKSFMGKLILCLFVALYIIIHHTICQ